MKSGSPARPVSIWFFAFGYFACYVPYSALTKALSSGLLRGMPRGFSGFELLPITNLASLCGMFAFITAMGWWQFAGHKKIFGRSVPMPNRWTFFSGVCTAAIIATTTLAYTFSGVSIVFMMLLMRGGVLVIAPIVDFVSRRAVRWFSWAALGLSLGALFVAFFGGSKSSIAMTMIAGVDVAIYLLGYFVRLRFMSRLAKSDDPNVTKRYFVEEQMSATPLVVLTLAICAIVGKGSIMLDIRHGFTTYWSSGYVLPTLLVGVLSQGTGIFGGLILLDRRENSFCVPVNRASSVLAGILASLSLSVLVRKPLPGMVEMFGAALVVGAILVLSVPGVLERRRLARA